jgi:hypothetical protein
MEGTPRSVSLEPHVRSATLLTCSTNAYEIWWTRGRTRWYRQRLNQHHWVSDMKVNYVKAAFVTSEFKLYTDARHHYAEQNQNIWTAIEYIF